MSNNYYTINDLSAIPLHSTGTYDSELIRVQSNAGRDITARASYITNFEDLEIALSAANLTISDIHIADPDTNLNANVIDIGTGIGALRVLSQDLEPVHDTVSLGDVNSNLVYVTLSALNVYTINPVTAVDVNNLSTYIGSLTSVIATATNQVTTNTLLNTLTASNATAINQVTTNNLLNALTASNATATNQITTNTLLNTVTANQATQITLEKTLSANSVYGTLSAQPLFVTVPTTAPLNVTYAASPQLDLTSRLRVAPPRQDWWYVSSVDKDGDLRYIETLTNGASSIYVQNLASCLMTSGSATNGSGIRGSRKRHKAIPGSSHTYHASINLLGKQSNVVKRFGIFTNFNGYFFELSGTNMNVVVRRRLVDGTLVEERVEQGSWNVDKLDGNGPSKENWSALTATVPITGWVSTTAITVSNTTVYNVVYGVSAGHAGDFRLGTQATITGVTPFAFNQTASIAAYDTSSNRLTATYIVNPGTFSSLNGSAQMYQTGWHMEHTFWFDFVGGRTNTVRFGKQSDSGPIVLHAFNFDGLLGSQYENAPALMDRKEIYNIGSVTSIPSMILAGVSYTTEAEATLNPSFASAYNNTPITLVAGKDQPVIGVALRSGEPYQRGDIQVQGGTVLDTSNLSNQNNTTNSVIQWKLVLNPGLSGIPSSTDIGKASRQWAYTSTAAITSAGIELLTGYNTSGAPLEVKTALNFLNMGSNLEYTDSDKIVLTARLIQAGTSTSTIVGSMNLIEAL